MLPDDGNCKSEPPRSPTVRAVCRDRRPRARDHLGTLYLLKELAGFHFVMAQGVATLTAMGFNYIVNYAMTYRNVPPIPSSIPPRRRNADIAREVRLDEGNFGTFHTRRADVTGR